MSTDVRVQLRCNLFGAWAMIRLMILERLDETEKRLDDLEKWR